MEFIFSLAIIIAATKLAGDLSVRLGQPSVLGKLIAGIIIGPAVLNWILPSSFIDNFAELGVLLLMFIAGLETDLDQLKRNWKASCAVAIGGIILPFIGGYSASLALGLSHSQSLFIGLLLCATSVSISVQTLKEMDALDTREGSTILGAAVVDDVIVVLMLAVMMSMLGTSEGSALGIIFAKKALFFVAILVVSVVVVPFIMKKLSTIRVTEPVMSTALILLCFYVYFAEKMGVAGIIGAFAAGIAISQTSYKHEVERKVEPIAYTLFVPVFFVSIGLSIQFDGIGGELGFLLLLTIIAIATKLLGGALGARMTGFGTRSAAAIGAGMVSRGEVALIIAASGLESQLLKTQYFTSVVLLVIVTTLVTPPLLKALFPRRGLDESNDRMKEMVGKRQN
ncbi:cation:proton antiporter [Paenibacillus xylaniclasticus]|uniref:cation:proton antiporter n=1 Tax=Paenibacillus xylaniclasticus TaxID=588083 RepID=UPI000FDA90E7|nr:MULTISPECIES: cation:proton antiporter [Paenibacillus]GFN31699.1 Na+/H+ antiporter GerT [Paenibacillus curdlanolyticus]